MTARIATTSRPRLRGGQRTRLAKRAAALYDAGASIRSLAEDEGLSYGTARALVQEGGGTLRGRGGARRPAVTTPEAGK
ncbi:helix-turn-helix domain-containing protein [Streptomyces sp. NPDC093108]|uniref:helix-turn-helix domain-containing protein n=1 Tax=unclassified Streptomyces TaxID=2593676 RepID=UPI003801895B